LIEHGDAWRVATKPWSDGVKNFCRTKKSFIFRNNFPELGDQRDLTPFDTNWKKGSGATPLTIQDL